MQPRGVEVAVGFGDQTWRNIQVDVPEDPNCILEDDEVSEKAVEIVTKMAVEADWNVTFLHVIYVETPDDMEGIV